MPVVDLKQPAGGCDVTLNNMSVKTDSASSGLIYKVDVLMILASRSEAAELGQSIPGLVTSYDLAGEDDNWKGTTSVRPAESLRITLTAKDAPAGLPQGTVQPGDAVIQGLAEVLELKASQSKRARVVQVRLVFRGQGPDVAGRLVSNLSRTVALAFERQQAQLPLRPAAPSLRPGMIVGATMAEGAQVVGRLVEVDNDRLTLHEAGEVFEVSAGAVLSSFAFAEDPDTTAALSAYAERCAEASVEPSWCVLVDVVNRRGGVPEGSASSGGVAVTLDDVSACMEVVAPGFVPAPVMEPVIVPDEPVQESSTEQEQNGDVVPFEIPKSGRRRRAAGMA